MKNYAILMSMIITNQTKNINQSANLQSASCSIDPEDMRYIASLLRNNYSDTILATMREIVANAIDVSNGEKIDVQLPTKIEPNFIVRDYGTGLSEEDMMGLYTKYGKSTKRDTNNAIGGFGIGRFAPLSYTDSFIVVSVNGDSKTSYSIRVDENDDTVVSILCSEQNSVERNGIYIQVPIENQHIEIFNKKFKNFSRYLQDSLNIKNDSFKYIEPEMSCDAFDYFNDRNVSYWSNSSQNEECNKAYVLMGGIMYPVTNNPPENFVKGVVYKAEIGEFKLHHSRESLEYNNQTVKKLEEASGKIATALRAQLQTNFNSCDCLYEATKIYFSTVSVYSHTFSKEAVDIDLGENKFEGESVNQFLFNGRRLRLTNVTHNRNGKLGFRSPKYLATGAYNPEDEKFFIIDDGVKPRAIANRLSFLKDGEAALVIHGEDEDAQNKLLDRFKMMKSAKVKLLSECERTIQKSTGQKKSSGSPLAGSDVLLFSMDHSYTQSDAWSAQKEDLPDNETYYYVRYYANKFQKIDGSPLFDSSDCPLNAKKFVQSLLHLNSNLKNVYGVRSSSLKKVEKKANWIPLESVYIDWIKKSDKVQDYMNLNDMQETFREKFGYDWAGFSRFIDQASGEIPSNQIIKNLKKVFDKRKTLADASYKTIRTLADLGIVKPNNAKQKKSVQEFNEKYPLFKRLVHASGFRDPNQDLSDVIDYVKNW